MKLSKKIWDEDEMGWITTDNKSLIECAKCNGKDESGAKDKIAHEEFCFQGIIFNALNVGGLSPDDT